MVFSGKPDDILMSQARGKSYRGGGKALLPCSKDNEHLFWCRGVGCYFTLTNSCQRRAEWENELSSIEGLLSCV